MTVCQIIKVWYEQASAHVRAPICLVFEDFEAFSADVSIVYLIYMTCMTATTGPR